MKKYASGVQGYRTWRWVRPPLNLTYLLIALLFSGCSRAESMRAGEAFRRIQEHEAIIGRASAERDSVDACGAGGLTVAICEHSEEICRIATELDDRDARARCFQARDTCAGARERDQAACATPPLHDSRS